MLDKQQLQTYRDAAAAAKALGNFYKDFAGLTIGMQMLIGNDIPALATAVDVLCVEVERLNERVCELECDLTNMEDLKDSIKGDLIDLRAEIEESEGDT